MANESARQGFRDWRRRRPFWGGLLMLKSALALFLSANLTLADMKVHFGQEGYLSYLLPAIMALCGLLIWFTPAQRLFYAVIGLVTALYSLIGLNLGGFGLGMLLGIIGGALSIAWSPIVPDPKDRADETGAGEPPAEDVETTQALPASGHRPERADPTYGRETAPFDPPGDGGAPAAILPGFDNRNDPRPPASGGGAHRKLFALLLVPLVVTAGVLIAGGQTPARADDDCPAGLPSRKVTAQPSATRTRPSARPTEKPPAEKPEPGPQPSSSPSAPASDPPAAEGGDSTGNPIVDGWNDFVEGVGELFGQEKEPSPTASPAPSAAPAPSGDTAPSPSAGTSGSPAPSKPAPATSPSATPSLPDVPCLGPRVFQEADPDDVPQVSAEHGVMEGKSLTMYDSTYDGETELQTAKGPIRVLKFSMRKSVTKPFSLTIPEAGGHTTVITSEELTVEGNVRFYTPKFTGKLFGLFPVEFTPEHPPPLTLPVLWFTDIRIDLAFVRSDVLTGAPLDVRE